MSTPQAPARLRYSINEAAEMLGVSRVTLYRRIREGHLTPVHDGRLTFITATELQRYASASVA